MKKILTALIVALAGIQLIPVTRTNPEVVSDFDGPAAVKAILKRSCYDCHSHETKWPWYSYVAPVSWMVSHHVEEGREYLNFSNWELLKNYPWMRSKIVAEIADGAMPMKSYLIAHPEADVSLEELDVLREWAGITPIEVNRKDQD